MEQFMDNFKRQVRFFGELLGPEAKVRADKYCRYFDAKIQAILAITSKIGTEDRPTVYYGGRSGNLLFSQGRPASCTGSPRSRAATFCRRLTTTTSRK